jgi:hypothetical protein
MEFVSICLFGIAFSLRKETVWSSKHISPSTCLHVITTQHAVTGIPSAVETLRPIASRTLKMRMLSIYRSAPQARQTWRPHIFTQAPVSLNELLTCFDVIGGAVYSKHILCD